MAMETLSLEPTTQGYLNMRELLIQQIQGGNTARELTVALGEIDAYLKAIGEL